MSYDIYLKDAEGNVLHAPERHNLAGGTMAVGGTTELWLNVTYNYARHFQAVLGPEGIRSLYGKRAVDTYVMLAEAISRLGTDTDQDYWQPTEGNARAALEALFQLGLRAPAGVWDGD